MSIFGEKYDEVANSINEIINAFYKKTDDYYGDEPIELVESYFESANNYKIAVSDCRENSIHELTFTVIGNQWLFNSFIDFFNENCNKNLDSKDYKFIVQEQSSCVAKINVIYK